MTNMPRFLEQFEKLEVSESLQSIRVSGYPIWDVVRAELFFLLLDLQNETPGGYSASLEKKGATKLGTIINKLWGAVRFTLRLRRCSTFVHMAARHIRSGQLVDVGLADLLPLSPKKQFVVEVSDLSSRFSDYVSHRSVLERLFGLCRDLSRHEVATLRKMCLRFSLEFDCNSEVLGRLARTVYRRFLFDVMYFDVLLQVLKPRVILVTQSGVQKGLYWVARKHGIPLLEAQHSLVNRYHPVYNYPRSTVASNVISPTILVTYSNYWCGEINLPGTRIVACGNSDNSTLLNRVDHKVLSDILIVSSTVHHGYFLEVLPKLLDNLPGHRFLYKLHPSQYASKFEIEKQLLSFPRVRVVGGDLPVPRLLSLVRATVVIQSTVAYESLASGVPTLILRVLDFEVLEGVFKHPLARVVSVSDSLLKIVQEIEVAPRKGHGTDFFLPFSPSRYRDLLEEILSGDAS